MKKDILDPAFEPIIQPHDEKSIRLEHDYTDDELLMELRRRGRLARVECENIVPEICIADGYPLAHQIRNAWDHIACEAARLHVRGKAPTGAKVETVQGDNRTIPASEKGRRVKFAVNYVIDRR